MDLVGTGIGGTRPASPFLDSRRTGEVFCRFHVTTNLAIAPEFQTQVRTSLNPSANAPRVFSLRGAARRLTLGNIAGRLRGTAFSP